MHLISKPIKLLYITHQISDSPKKTPEKVSQVILHIYEPQWKVYCSLCPWFRPIIDVHLLPNNYDLQTVSYIVCYFLYSIRLYCSIKYLTVWNSLLWKVIHFIILNYIKFYCEILKSTNIWYTLLHCIIMYFTILYWTISYCILLQQIECNLLYSTV